MEEIGNLFLLTREAAGVSLKEASEDLDIEEAILENIEDGKSGAFSDVFVLKSYVANYAKYLGLDTEKVVDEFNEYIFEATSRIPVKTIEKQIEQSKKETEENVVVSPYTKKNKTVKQGLYLVMYIVLILLFIVAVFWGVRQIVFSNQDVSVSYHK